MVMRAFAHLHEDRGVRRVLHELVLAGALVDGAREGERATAQLPFRAELEVAALGRIEIRTVRTVAAAAGDQREVGAAGRLLRSRMRQIDAAVLDGLEEVYLDRVDSSQPPGGS